MGYQTFAKEASPLSRGRFAALRASLSRQRRLIRHSASSERTSYPSLPCKHESSLTPSLLLFLANPLALGFARTDSGSQELCRLQIRFIVVLCYPFKKSTKIYFVTSLLLARNFLLAFTVQFSRCSLPVLFKTRLKCSDVCPNTSIYSWWRLPDSNR